MAFQRRIVCLCPRPVSSLSLSFFQEHKDENLIEDDYEKLREQNNEAENKDKEHEKDDQKADDLAEAKATKKKLTNVVKKVKKWQKNPIFKVRIPVYRHFCLDTDTLQHGMRAMIFWLHTVLFCFF